MFAKVFASLWNGSMVGKPDAQLVFVYLLAHADSDGFVDHHPDTIAALTGLPPDRVRAALAELESTDPHSRSEASDGRRLERRDAHRDWGWFIVNHAHYRGLRDEETRRQQNREAQARRRANADSQHMSAHVSHRQPTTEDRQQTAETERIKSLSSPAATLALSLNGSEPDSPEFLSFPCVGTGPKAYRITEAGVQRLAGLFPGPDVRQSLRNALAWILANPAKRKTARGMDRFIASWLTRDQESGRTPRAVVGAGMSIDDRAAAMVAAMNGGKP